jgi:hypothetical protein
MGKGAVHNHKTSVTLQIHNIFVMSLKLDPTLYLKRIQIRTWIRYFFFMWFRIHVMDKDNHGGYKCHK